MKHFVVTFFEKGKGPKPSPFAKVEGFNAMAQEDVLPLLYERLKLSKEQFEAKYHLAEITETTERRIS